MIEGNPIDLKSLKNPYILDKIQNKEDKLIFQWNHSLNESLDSSILSLLGGKQKLNSSLKHSFCNYPWPKLLRTKEKPKPINPNNPENKEFHFEISLNNAVSLNLSEINPDTNKIFPRKEKDDTNIFCQDLFEQS